MTSPIPRILFGLAVSLAAVDAVWALLGHFSIAVIAYARLRLLALALFFGGIFYQTRRPDPNLAAMLTGASFLIVFSAGASLLNYFLLTVAGPRIDDVLAGMDSAMGFDWVAVMTAMVDHPRLNQLFFFAYGSTLPQLALLLVALAWSGRPQEVYRFCLAIAVAALITIGVWALAPSFGAESVYALPDAVARALGAPVDGEYGRVLVGLLHNGPGFITPADLRGLIGFPSYHAAMALLIVWYARGIAWLRWPVLALNLVVLASTPVQGGHHLMDVLGGVVVTALAIWLVRGAEKIRLPALLAAGGPLPPSHVPSRPI